MINALRDQREHHISIMLKHGLFFKMDFKSRIISTDEDPSLRIECSAIINLRGVSTKLNKYIHVYLNIPTFLLNLSKYNNYRYRQENDKTVENLWKNRYAEHRCICADKK